MKNLITKLMNIIKHVDSTSAEEYSTAINRILNHEYEIINSFDNPMIKTQKIVKIIRN